MPVSARASGNLYLNLNLKPCPGTTRGGAPRRRCVTRATARKCGDRSTPVSERLNPNPGIKGGAPRRRCVTRATARQCSDRSMPVSARASGNLYLYLNLNPSPGTTRRGAPRRRCVTRATARKCGDRSTPVSERASGKRRRSSSVDSPAPHRAQGQAYPSYHGRDSAPVLQPANQNHIPCACISSISPAPTLYTKQLTWCIS